MTRPHWINRDAQTIWELVDARADQSGDRPMLFDEHDRAMTYAEFRVAAERCAAGLHTLGINAETRVSWQLPTRIETVVLSTALSRLGAVQNPIIPIYGRREVASVLEQTAAEWFVVLDESFPVECQVLVLDARIGEPGFPDGDPATLPPPPSAVPEADAPIRWIYTTSGTTSLPKGVRHTDRSLLAGGTDLARALEPSATDDIGLFAVPYAHIAGPDFIVLMLTTAMPTMVIDGFVPGPVVEHMRRHRITITGGATAIYQAFLAVQRTQPDVPILPDLRILIGGGGPKPPEIYWEVLREMGVRIVHGYGMTECPMIAEGTPFDTDEQLANTDGKPVPRCEVRVVTDDDTIAPAGGEGELRVRGPMLFKGYTDAEQTAAAFDADGFFRTGDLGVIRADGHVCVTGRLKDVIIRKGENIGAQEVETVLYEHPKVAAVAVIGLPDAERGERVCAVVELVRADDPLGFEEMQEHCLASGLSKRKWPEQLEIIDALPRNATMKVLKYELRERYS